MALTTRLEFRQSQALVMTPQLMQAIKLLQLSNLDLLAYVEEELEKNPLLERVGRGRRSGHSGRSQWRRGRRGAGRRGRLRMDGRAIRSPPAATPSRTNSAPGSTTCSRRMAARRSPRRATRMPPPQHSEWASVGSGGREDGDYNLEAFVSAERTLADHLAEQLSLAVDRSGAAHDRPASDRYGRRGGLPHRAISPAVAEKLGADLAEVEAVLAILQNFDPAGVCARNLTECLAIQLRDRNRYDPGHGGAARHASTCSQSAISPR